MCRCACAYICVAPHIQLLSKHCWHLKTHLLHFLKHLRSQDYYKKCSKHEIIYIYILTLGLLQCFQRGPRKHIFINLGRPQGKMSRVETGSFLWVLKISRQAWGCKWGLKSLLASRAHLGYKAIMGAQIYPITFEYQLELPAMSKRNFRVI